MEAEAQMGRFHSDSKSRDAFPVEVMCVFKVPIDLLSRADRKTWPHCYVGCLVFPTFRSFHSLYIFMRLSSRSLLLRASRR